MMKKELGSGLLWSVLGITLAIANGIVTSKNQDAKLEKLIEKKLNERNA